MTIFDKLKYHISWPPQEGELEALPPALHDAWFKKVYNYYDTNTYKDKIDILRSMIAEWDA
jgi:hypothetical protein